jgi:flagellar M-ring protein FliF
LATAKSAPAAASAQSASSAVLPPLYPQAMQQGETVREESGSYAVSHHTSHTQQGPEHIRRVTTAVVVNDRASVENAGKVEQTVWKPRSADEMKRLEQLAQAAVGFDLARGDQVIVENIGFSTNVPEAKPAALDRVMEQAGSLARSGAAHTLMIAACGLVLVFMVVRPLTKQVSVALMQPALLTASSAGTAQAGRQSASVNAIQPSKENASRNYLLDRKPAGQNEDFNTQLHREQKTDHAQGVFDHVTDHIRREPLESKRLLENWISTHHAEGEI